MTSVRRPLLVLASLLVAVVALPAAAHAQDATGTVTILHGVPDLEVDIYVDGEPLVTGFAPGEQFGPAELPAADYTVDVRPAGADADSDPAITADITVPEGVNATAIAHLDAEGTPVLTVFVNDTSSIATGEARLAVRHTAQFGEVDVLAGGDAIVSSLSNGEEQVLDVPADTYDVAVTAAGDPDTEALRADLTLEEGTAYLVHAIGDPGAGTFDVLIQTIEGLHTPPSGVPAGTGPVNPDRNSTLPLLALLAAVVLAGGATGRALLQR